MYMISSPLTCSVDNAPSDVQRELIDLQSDNLLAEHFKKPKPLQLIHPVDCGAERGGPGGEQSTGSGDTAELSGVHYASDSLLAPHSPVPDHTGGESSWMLCAAFLPQALFLKRIPAAVETAGLALWEQIGCCISIQR
ncbi:hypothetical protein AOLI_G00087640 [Acnodon oligacanthus]